MRPPFFLLPAALVLITAPLLAGCHAEKPDWAKQSGQTVIPAALCKEIDKGIAQLRTSPLVEITEKGEATMPTALWNQMPADQHDQMIRTIAFHAACKAGAQSDAQRVVVHGDDGTQLADRTISTRVDTTELLRGEDR